MISVKISNLFFTILIGFSILLSPTARAKDINNEMSFSLYYSDLRPQFGLFQFVYASGELNSGTTERFIDFIKKHKLLPGAKVIFNSPGGSLIEGMKLGEAIRELGFSTDIGTRGQPQVNSAITPEMERYLRAMGADPFPPETLVGICYSSCSLAYLGGVHRYLKDGSLYGVHRFSSPSAIIDMDQTQIISGEIVNYIQRMGADSKLFVIWSTTGPTDIEILSKNQMMSLGIATGSVIKDEWSLKSVPEGIYLVGEHIDERGTSKATFLCGEKSLVGTISIPTAGQSDLVLQDTERAGLLIDSEIHHLSDGNKITASKISDSLVLVFWSISHSDISAILTAKKSWGFAFFPSDTEGLFVGTQIGFGENGHEMISNYATNCWR